jgi:hypothetical protein
MYLLLPGLPLEDGTSRPMWFSPSGLPEKLSDAEIALARDDALRQGVFQIDADSLARASKSATGERWPVLAVDSRVDLLKAVAAIVLSDDGGASSDLLNALLSAPTHTPSEDMLRIMEDAQRGR